MENKDTKVLVGISGGVDSAVCALILKQQGYDVVGAMMKVYDGNSKTIANSCYGVDKTKEINDAINICEKIGIEFNLIDCSKEFDKYVFSTFKKEYMNGRTPNPCVLCNPLIKFGFFPKIAKEKGIEFDKFATGHYARIEYDHTLGKFLLKKGANILKDQSYFLYALTQDKIKNILFPLGNMQKENVRNFARENGLLVHDKSDSQDFYAGNYTEIIDTKPVKGNIVHTSGKKLGEHNGVFNYTIGQRKGIKIAYSEPLYVIKLNADKNEVIVGEKPYTFSKGCYANNASWTYFDELKNSLRVQAKIRSRGNTANCKITPDKDSVLVEFDEEQSAITPGQAVVFYDDDVVLGGAVIQKPLV